VQGLKVRYSSKHDIAFQYENMQMKCGFPKSVLGGHLNFFNYHQIQVPSSEIQNQGASSGYLKN
jgi:hypothetical protein